MVDNGHTLEIKKMSGKGIFAIEKMNSHSFILNGDSFFA